MDTNEFISKASIVHNGLYNYEKTVYVKSTEKVTIICNIHGDFKQSPNNHLNNKQGCPKCFGKFKYTTCEFVTKCSELHKNKYDYSLVEYTNNKTKVKIICPVHGLFEQKAVHHLAGKECIKCAAKDRAAPRKYDTKIFIDKANEIHNNIYNYDNVDYELSTKKIIITCIKHGNFLQNPAHHLQGQGCPKCNLDANSNGNRIISEFLTKNNIVFESEKRFKDCRNINPLPFDFYIPSLNMCIEYDGEQHFIPIPRWGGEEKFQKIKLHDSIKNEYCIDNNINLIRISYEQNLFELLSKLFKSTE